MPARHAPPLAPAESPPRQSRQLRFAVACVVLAVQGCASVTPRAAAPYPVEVPEAWSITGLSAAGGRASMAQWWSRFDDPLLSTLVVRALEANTSVKCAQAALRQARASRDLAAAGLLPAVGARHRQGAAPPAGRFSTSFRAGLTRVGSSTFSAATAARSRPARQRRRPAPRAWATCRCRSPPRWRSTTLRCAPPRRGSRSRTTTSRASSRYCRSRSGAFRRGWSRRSKRSRRAPGRNRRALSCQCSKRRSSRRAMRSRC